MSMARMTNQKKALHESVQKFTSFFTASDLHAAVVKKDKRLGLATIYRYLNTLENTGALHSFLCNGKKIYSTGKTSHAHYKCEHCGKTQHLRIKNADFLADCIDEEICHFQLELTGVCSKCKKK